MITIKPEFGQGGKHQNTDLDKVLRGMSAFATVAVKNPIIPATEGNSAAAVNAAIGGAALKFVQTVTIELRNEDDEVLTGFDGSVGPVGVLSIAKTSAAGLVAIDAASILSVNGQDKPIFVRGVATVLINYTGTWVNADDVTLTLTNATMAEANSGDTVTFVDTLIA
jgi:hypothetical protein